MAQEEKSKLIKLRDAEIEDARGKGATTTELKVIMAEYREAIRLKTNDVLEEESHFNFPKIHLLLHVVESIRMFGTLGQYNSSISETAHKESKEGFRRSNKTGDWTKQILNRSARREAFALHQKGREEAENNRDQDNYRPKKDENRANSSKRSRQGNTLFRETKDERNRYPEVIPGNVSPPPPMFIGLRAPTNKFRHYPIRTMFDVMESAAIPGFKEAFTTYVETVLQQPFSAESHLRSPASLYHGIQLFTRRHGADDWVKQKIRCSPNRDWYNGSERLDWAWIRVHTSEKRRSKGRSSIPSTSGSMKALGGRLPVRLRCLFRVNVSDFRGVGRAVDLVLCELPMAEKGGGVDPHTGLVTLRRPDTMPASTSRKDDFRGYINEDGANLRILGAWVIDGAAHCIPLQHEGPEVSWFVNPHIDLATWNAVY